MFIYIPKNKGFTICTRHRANLRLLRALKPHPSLAGIPTLTIEFGDVITPLVRLYKYTVQHSTTVCMCVHTLVCMSVS